MKNKTPATIDEYIGSFPFEQIHSISFDRKDNQLQSTGGRKEEK